MFPLGDVPFTRVHGVVIDVRGRACGHLIARPDCAVNTNSGGAHLICAQPYVVEPPTRDGKRAREPKAQYYLKQGS